MRYHVIYGVFYTIMYVARGSGDDDTFRRKTSGKIDKDLTGIDAEEDIDGSFTPKLCIRDVFGPREYDRNFESSSQIDRYKMRRDVDEEKRREISGQEPLYISNSLIPLKHRRKRRHKFKNRHQKLVDKEPRERRNVENGIEMMEEYPAKISPLKTLEPDNLYEKITIKRAANTSAIKTTENFFNDPRQSVYKNQQVLPVWQVAEQSFPVSESVDNSDQKFFDGENRLQKLQKSLLGVGHQQVNEMVPLQGYNEAQNSESYKSKNYPPAYGLANFESSTGLNVGYKSDQEINQRFVKDLSNFAQLMQTQAQPSSNSSEVPQAGGNTGNTSMQGMIKCEIPTQQGGNSDQVTVNQTTHDNTSIQGMKYEIPTQQGGNSDQVTVNQTTHDNTSMQEMKYEISTQHGGNADQVTVNQTIHGNTSMQGMKCELSTQHGGNVDQVTVNQTTHGNTSMQGMKYEISTQQGGNADQVTVNQTIHGNTSMQGMKYEISTQQGGNADQVTVNQTIHGNTSMQGMKYEISTQQGGNADQVTVNQTTPQSVTTENTKQESSLQSVLPKPFQDAINNTKSYIVNFGISEIPSQNLFSAASTETASVSSSTTIQKPVQNVTRISEIPNQNLSSAASSETATASSSTTIQKPVQNVTQNVSTGFQSPLIHRVQNAVDNSLPQYSRPQYSFPVPVPNFQQTINQGQINSRNPYQMQPSSQQLLPIRSRGLYNYYNEYRNPDPNSPNDYKPKIFNEGVRSPTNKFKRGFQLVQLPPNLYAIRDDGMSEGSKNEIGQWRLKLKDQEKDDKTSAMLSFKAHMHHRVEDIGKPFMKYGQQISYKPMNTDQGYFGSSSFNSFDNVSAGIENPEYLNTYESKNFYPGDIAAQDVVRDPSGLAFQKVKLPGKWSDRIESFRPGLGMNLPYANGNNNPAYRPGMEAVGESANNPMTENQYDIEEVDSNGPEIDEENLQPRENYLPPRNGSYSNVSVNAKAYNVPQGSNSEPYEYPMSVMVSENPALQRPLQEQNNQGNSGVKEKSFSMVIKPLTTELHKLLATIKLVNRDLVKEKKRSAEEEETSKISLVKNEGLDVEPKIDDLTKGNTPLSTRVKRTNMTKKSAVDEEKSNAEIHVEEVLDKLKIAEPPEEKIENFLEGINVEQRTGEESLDKRALDLYANDRDFENTLELEKKLYDDEPNDKIESSNPKLDKLVNYSQEKAINKRLGLFKSTTPTVQAFTEMEVDTQTVPPASKRPTEPKNGTLKNSETIAGSQNFTTLSATTVRSTIAVHLVTTIIPTSAVPNTDRDRIVNRTTTKEKVIDTQSTMNMISVLGTRTTTGMTYPGETTADLTEPPDTSMMSFSPRSGPSGVILEAKSSVDSKLRELDEPNERKYPENDSPKMTDVNDYRGVDSTVDFGNGDNPDFVTEHHHQYNTPFHESDQKYGRNLTIKKMLAEIKQIEADMTRMKDKDIPFAEYDDDYDGGELNDMIEDVGDENYEFQKGDDSYEDIESGDNFDEENDSSFEGGDFDEKGVGTTGEKLRQFEKKNINFETQIPIENSGTNKTNDTFKSHIWPEHVGEVSNLTMAKPRKNETEESLTLVSENMRIAKDLKENGKLGNKISKSKKRMAVNSSTKGTNSHGGSKATMKINEKNWREKIDDDKLQEKVDFKNREKRVANYQRRIHSAAPEEEGHDNYEADDHSEKIEPQNVEKKLTTVNEVLKFIERDFDTNKNSAEKLIQSTTQDHQKKIGGFNAYKELGSTSKSQEKILTQRNEDTKNKKSKKLKTLAGHGNHLKTSRPESHTVFKSNDRANNSPKITGVILNPYLPIVANTEINLNIYESDFVQKNSGHEMVKHQPRKQLGTKITGVTRNKAPNASMKSKLLEEDSEDHEEELSELHRNYDKRPGYIRLGRNLKSVEEIPAESSIEKIQKLIHRKLKKLKSNNSTIDKKQNSKSLNLINQNSQYHETVAKASDDDEYFLSFKDLKNLDLRSVVGLEPVASGVIVHRGKMMKKRQFVKRNVLNPTTMPSVSTFGSTEKRTQLKSHSNSFLDVVTLPNLEMMPQSEINQYPTATDFLNHDQFESTSQRYLLTDFLRLGDQDGNYRLKEDQENTRQDYVTIDEPTMSAESTTQKVTNLKKNLKVKTSQGMTVEKKSYSQSTTTENISTGKSVKDTEKLTKKPLGISEVINGTLTTGQGIDKDEGKSSEMNEKSEITTEGDMSSELESTTGIGYELGSITERSTTSSTISNDGTTVQKFIAEETSGLVSAETTSEGISTAEFQPVTSESTFKEIFSSKETTATETNLSESKGLEHTEATQSCTAEFTNESGVSAIETILTRISTAQTKNPELMQISTVELTQESPISGNETIVTEFSSVKTDELEVTQSSTAERSETLRVSTEETTSTEISQKESNYTVVTQNSTTEFTNESGVSSLETTLTSISMEQTNNPQSTLSKTFKSTISTDEMSLTDPSSSATSEFNAQGATTDRNEKSTVTNNGMTLFESSSPEMSSIIITQSSAAELANESGVSTTETSVSTISVTQINNLESVQSSTVEQTEISIKSMTESDFPLNSSTESEESPISTKLSSKEISELEETLGSTVKLDDTVEYTMQSDLTAQSVSEMATSNQETTELVSNSENSTEMTISAKLRTELEEKSDSEKTREPRITSKSSEELEISSSTKISYEKTTKLDDVEITVRRFVEDYKDYHETPMESDSTNSEEVSTKSVAVEKSSKKNGHANTEHHVTREDEAFSFSPDVTSTEATKSTTEIGHDEVSSVTLEVTSANTDETTIGTLFTTVSEFITSTYVNLNNVLTSTVKYRHKIPNEEPTLQPFTETTFLSPVPPQEITPDKNETRSSFSNWESTSKSTDYPEGSEKTETSSSGFDTEEEMNKLSSEVTSTERISSEHETPMSVSSSEEKMTESIVNSETISTLSFEKSSSSSFTEATQRITPCNEEPDSLQTSEYEDYVEENINGSTNGDKIKYATENTDEKYITQVHSKYKERLSKMTSKVTTMSTTKQLETSIFIFESQSATNIKNPEEEATSREFPSSDTSMFSEEVKTTGMNIWTTEIYSQNKTGEYYLTTEPLPTIGSMKPSEKNIRTKGINEKELTLPNLVTRPQTTKEPNVKTEKISTTSKTSENQDESTQSSEFFRSSTVETTKLEGQREETNSEETGTPFVSDHGEQQSQLMSSTSTTSTESSSEYLRIETTTSRDQIKEGQVTEGTTIGKINTASISEQEQSELPTMTSVKNLESSLGYSTIIAAESTTSVPGLGTHEPVLTFSEESTKSTFLYPETSITGTSEIGRKEANVTERTNTALFISEQEQSTSSTTPSEMSFASTSGYSTTLSGSTTKYVKEEIETTRGTDMGETSVFISEENLPTSATTSSENIGTMSSEYSANSTKISTIKEEGELLQETGESGTSSFSDQGQFASHVITSEGTVGFSSGYPTIAEITTASNPDEAQSPLFTQFPTEIVTSSLDFTTSMGKTVKEGEEEVKATGEIGIGKSNTASISDEGQYTSAITSFTSSEALTSQYPSTLSTTDIDTMINSEQGQSLSASVLLGGSTMSTLGYSPDFTRTTIGGKLIEDLNETGLMNTGGTSTPLSSVIELEGSKFSSLSGERSTASISAWTSSFETPFTTSLPTGEEDTEVKRKEEEKEEEEEEKVKKQKENEELEKEANELLENLRNREELEKERTDNENRERELDRKEAELDRKDEDLKEKENKLNEKEENEKEIEDKEISVGNKEKELEEKEDQLRKNFKDNNKIQKEIEEEKRREKEIEKTVTEIENEAEELKENEEKLGNELEKNREVENELKEEKEKLNKEMKKENELEDELKETEDKKKYLEELVTEVEKQGDDEIKDKDERLQKEMKERNENELGLKECGKRVKDLEEMVTEVEKEANKEIENDKNRLDEQLEKNIELENKLNETETEEKNLEKVVTEVEHKADELEKKEKELTDIVDKKLTEEEKKENDLEQTVTEINQEVTELEEEKKNLAEELKEKDKRLEEELKEKNTLEDELKEKKKREKELEEKESEIGKKEKELDKKEDELSKEMEDTDKKNKELNDEERREKDFKEKETEVEKKEQELAENEEKLANELEEKKNDINKELEEKSDEELKKIDEKEKELNKKKTELDEKEKDVEDKKLTNEFEERNKLDKDLQEIDEKKKELDRKEKEMEEKEKEFEDREEKELEEKLDRENKLDNKETELEKKEKDIKEKEENEKMKEEELKIGFHTTTRNSEPTEQEKFEIKDTTPTDKNEEESEENNNTTTEETQTQGRESEATQSELEVIEQEHDEDKDQETASTNESDILASTTKTTAKTEEKSTPIPFTESTTHTPMPPIELTQKSTDDRENIPTEETKSDIQSITEEQIDKEKEDEEKEEGEDLTQGSTGSTKSVTEDSERMFTEGTSSDQFSSEKEDEQESKTTDEMEEKTIQSTEEYQKTVEDQESLPFSVSTQENGEYHYDKDEEVWKNRKDEEDNLEKNSKKYHDEELEPKDFNEEENSSPENLADCEENEGVTPERVTKKICLNVLDIIDQTKPLNPATETVCEKNYPNRGRQIRNLLNFDKGSIPKSHNQDEEANDQKNLLLTNDHESNNLNREYREWRVNDDSDVTPVLSKCYTRMYEKVKYEKLEPIIRKNKSNFRKFPVMDETFMHRNWLVNDKGLRLQPTQISRLGEGEWTETRTKVPNVSKESKSRSRDARFNSTGFIQLENQLQDENSKSGIIRDGEKTRGHCSATLYRRDIRKQRCEDSGKTFNPVTENVMIPTSRSPKENGMCENSCATERNAKEDQFDDEEGDFEDEKSDEDSTKRICIKKGNIEEPESPQGEEKIENEEEDERTTDSFDHKTTEKQEESDEEQKSYTETIDRFAAQTEEFDVGYEYDEDSKKNSESDDKKPKSSDYNEEEKTGEGEEITQSLRTEEQTTSSIGNDGTEERQQTTTISSVDKANDIEIKEAALIREEENLLKIRKKLLKNEEILTIKEKDELERKTNLEIEKEKQETIKNLVTTPLLPIFTLENLQDMTGSEKPASKDIEIQTPFESFGDFRKGYYNRDYGNYKNIKAEEKREPPSISKGEKNLKTSSSRILIPEVDDRLRSKRNSDPDVIERKESFTVKVMHLEYDEDEENNKPKCVDPKKEELVVREKPEYEIEGENLVEKSTKNENDESPTKNMNLEYDAEEENNKIIDSKNLTSNDNDEDLNRTENNTHSFSGVTELDRYTDANAKSKKPHVENSSTEKIAIRDQPIERTTPGREWPTEMYTKYHVGGTRTWDKELDGDNIAVSSGDEKEEEEDEGKEELETSGTTENLRMTCFMVVVDKNRSGGDLNLKSYSNVVDSQDVESTADQIEKPQQLEKDFSERAAGNRFFMKTDPAGALDSPGSESKIFHKKRTHQGKSQDRIISKNVENFSVKSVKQPDDSLNRYNWEYDFIKKPVTVSLSIGDFLTKKMIALIDATSQKIDNTRAVESTDFGTDGKSLKSEFERIDLQSTSNSIIEPNQLTSRFTWGVSKKIETMTKPEEIVTTKDVKKMNPLVSSSSKTESGSGISTQSIEVSSPSSYQALDLENRKKLSTDDQKSLSSDAEGFKNSNIFAVYEVQHEKLADKDDMKSLIDSNVSKMLKTDIHRSQSITQTPSSFQTNKQDESQEELMADYDEQMKDEDTSSSENDDEFLAEFKSFSGSNLEFTTGSLISKKETFAPEFEGKSILAYDNAGNRHGRNTTFQCFGKYCVVPKSDIMKANFDSANLEQRQTSTLEPTEMMYLDASTSPTNQGITTNCENCTEGTEMVELESTSGIPEKKYTEFENHFEKGIGRLEQFTIPTSIDDQMDFDDHQQTSKRQDYPDFTRNGLIDFWTEASGVKQRSKISKTAVTKMTNAVEDLGRYLIDIDVDIETRTEISPSINFPDEFRPEKNYDQLPERRVVPWEEKIDFRYPGKPIHRSLLGLGRNLKIEKREDVGKFYSKSNLSEKKKSEKLFRPELDKVEKSIEKNEDDVVRKEFQENFPLIIENGYSKMKSNRPRSLLTKVKEIINKAIGGTSFNDDDDQGKETGSESSTKIHQPHGEKLDRRKPGLKSNRTENLGSKIKNEAAIPERKKTKKNDKKVAKNKVSSGNKMKEELIFVTKNMKQGKKRKSNSVSGGKIRKTKPQVKQNTKKHDKENTKNKMTGGIKSVSKNERGENLLGKDLEKKFIRSCKALMGIEKGKIKNCKKCELFQKSNIEKADDSGARKSGSVVPMVKDLVKKNNFGNIEKIIVYVDKNKNKNGEQFSDVKITGLQNYSPEIQIVNLHDRSSKENEKPVSKIDSSINQTASRISKSNFGSLANPKWNKKSHIKPAIHIRQKREPGNLKPIFFKTGNSGSKEARKTDEKIGQTKSGKPNYGKERRMNLANVPNKKRRNWFNKIKNVNEASQSLAKLRKELLRELKRKVRSKRKRLLQDKTLSGIKSDKMIFRNREKEEESKETSGRRRIRAKSKDKKGKKQGQKKKEKKPKQEKTKGTKSKTQKSPKKEKHEKSGNINEKIKIYYALNENKNKSSQKSKSKRQVEEKFEENRGLLFDPKNIKLQGLLGAAKERSQKTEILKRDAIDEGELGSRENLYDSIAQIVGSKKVSSSSPEIDDPQKQNQKFTKADQMSTGSAQPNETKIIASAMNESRIERPKNKFQKSDAEKSPHFSDDLDKQYEAMKAKLKIDEFLDQQKEEKNATGMEKINDIRSSGDNKFSQTGQKITKTRSQSSLNENSKDHVDPKRDHIEEFTKGERNLTLKADFDKGQLKIAQNLNGEIKNRGFDTAEKTAEKIVQFAIHLRSKLDDINNNNNESKKRVRDVSSEQDVNLLVDTFGTDVLGLTDEYDRQSLRRLIDDIVNVERNVNTTLEIIESRLKNMETTPHSMTDVIKLPKNVEEEKLLGKQKEKLVVEGKDKTVFETKAAEELKKILDDLVGSGKNNKNGKDVIEAKKKLKNIIDDMIGSKFKDEVLTLKGNIAKGEELDGQKREKGSDFSYFEEKEIGAGESVAKIGEGETDKEKKKSEIKDEKQKVSSNVESHKKGKKENLKKETKGKSKGKEKAPGTEKSSGKKIDADKKRLGIKSNTNSPKKEEKSEKGKLAKSSKPKKPENSKKATPKSKSKEAEGKQIDQEIKNIFLEDAKCHEKYIGLESSDDDSNFHSVKDDDQNSVMENNNEISEDVEDSVNNEESLKTPNFISRKVQSSKISGDDQRGSKSWKKKTFELPKRARKEIVLKNVNGSECYILGCNEVNSETDDSARKKIISKKSAAVNEEKNNLTIKKGKKTPKKYSRGNKNGEKNIKSTNKTEAVNTLNKKLNFGLKTGSKIFTGIKSAEYLDVNHEILNKSNFRDSQKKGFEVSREERYSPLGQNCSHCICDIGKAVEELKGIISIKNGDLISRIKLYNCTKFKDIGNEITLTDTEDYNPSFRSRRDLRESKRETKYVRPEEVEEILQGNLKTKNIDDREMLSLPGLTLNVPCNGMDDMFALELNRLNYSWVNPDGSFLSGTMVGRNGNLKLYDIDIKDVGKYSCILTYTDPETEEQVINVYNHSIQVVTLPSYSLQGINRYELDANLNCDETGLDALTTFLPKKLNTLLCGNDICDIYVVEPRCYRGTISINTLLIPSSTAKLIPVGSTIGCDIYCRKAIQNKISLIFSRNLKNLLQKKIVFRFSYRNGNLKPIKIVKKSSKRRKRNSSKKKNKQFDKTLDQAEVALLIGCPGGYGFKNTNCYPCNPGHYSEEGSFRCKKCTSGTYQTDPGSRYCRVCTNPFVDGCFQTLWKYNSVIMIITFAACVLIIASVLLISCCLLKARKNSCARSMEIPTQYNFVKPNNIFKATNRTCASYTDAKKLAKKLDYRLKRAKIQKKRKFAQDCAALKREQDLNTRRLKLAQKHGDNNGRDHQRYDKVCQLVSRTGLESYRSHLGHRNICGRRLDFYNRQPPCVPLPDFDR